jgi:hypothetical protein
LEEAPLAASVPLAPPDVPELEPPLGALELVLGLEVLPVALEPYCFMQSSRSVPLMPTHWLGSGSLLVAPDDALLGLLEVLGDVELEPPVEVP